MAGSAAETFSFGSSPTAQTAVTFKTNALTETAMNKKIKLATALLCSVLVSTPAIAAKTNHVEQHDRYQWAKVTRVEPIYRTVTVTTPREECWMEDVHRPIFRHYEGHSAGSTVLGGLIGGAIGHEIGRHINRGRGRHGATVAGAVIGAAIGHDKAHRRDHGHRHDTVIEQEKRCRVIEESHTEQRLEGYDVTYRYRGVHYTSFMHEHPGKRIRVNVNVTPAGG